MYRWVWIMLLCVAGMLLLSACFFGGTVMSAQYDHAQDYQTGAFSYEAAKVRQVNVNWYSGSVSLKVTEREKPEVSESGTDLPAEKALHWRLDGEVLYVEFCASGYVGRFSGADKKLTVEVPKGILLNVTTTSAGIAADIGEQAEVTLHSTSGTIEVTDGTVAGKLTLGTTSGGIQAEKTEAAVLAAETTSGTIRLESAKITESASLESTSGGIRAERMMAVGGTVSVRSNSGSVRLEEVRAKTLTAKTTSGGVTLGMYACEQASVHTTSGSVRLNLGPELGVSVSVQSTSGGFNGSGFKSQDGNRYVWGDGACPVDIRTTSGSVTVR